MGFFKEFKEDLTQAVNELMPEDEFAEDEMPEDLDDSQIVDMLESGETVQEEPEAEELLEEIPEEEPILEEEEKTVENKPEEEETQMDDLVINETPIQEPEPKQPEEAVVKKAEAAAPEEAGRTPADNLTIITKGTRINGSIISDGSLEVKGTVTGDIECLGKLTIEGSVAGNSKASEIFVSAPKMKGSISSDGAVKIGLGTIIVGDVKGTSSVIAGAVKGDIDVDGPVIIDSTAIVKGNITAKSVQINNGAVVDGYCSLSYSDVAIDDFFEDEMA